MNYSIRGIIIILILGLFGEVNGQWIPDPTFSGSNINKIKHLGEDIFILSNKNLFKSNDLGQNWIFINGIPDPISDFDVNSKNGLVAVIAGQYTDKLYLSRNAGVDWELRGETDGENILLTENSIFSYNFWLNRSNDLGLTWEEVFHIPGTQGTPTALANIGDTLFLGTGYREKGYGLQRSNDNGDNWYQDILPESQDRIYQIDTFDSIVYVSASGSNGAHVIRSGDFGDSWKIIEEITPGFNEEYYNLDTNSDTLVVCDYDKLRASFDRGNSWKALNLPFFEKWNPIASIMLMGPHLFIGTRNGIYYTNDLGETWEKRSDGIYAGNVLFSYKKTIKNLFMVKDAKLYKKRGNNFDLITLPTNNELGYVHTAGNLLLITVHDNSGDQGTLYDYYASIDEGLTFSKLDLPRENNWLHGIVNYENYYILSLGSSIYRSVTQDAISWEKIYSDGRIQQICGFNNEIFGLSDGYELISSKDNGHTWSSVNNQQLDTVYIESIISSSENLYVKWRYEKEISYNYYRRASGVYRYNGLEWELINYTKQPINSQHLYVDNTFIGLLSKESILLSNDSGDSFKNFRNGINSNRIEPKEILSFQDSIFLLLTGGGTWKRALNEMDFTPLPTPYNLQGVYDGNSITITWEIDASIHDGFIIEKLPSFHKEYDRVGSGIMEYVDLNSNLEAIYRATYRVFTYDNEGWSLPSERLNIDLANFKETDENLKLFPNPVNHELYLKYDISPVVIKVFDLKGKEMKTNFEQLSDNTIRIDLGMLPKQLLILEITFSDGSTKFQRVIKE